MRLAARGSRHVGKAVEKIEDQEELEQVGSQARKVQFKTVVVGMTMTLLALLLP